MNLGQSLFELHLKIWNKNDSDVFVVISDEETHVCASKNKPNGNDPLACSLHSFRYGVNSPVFEKEQLKPLLKESINSGFFWHFVSDEIAKKKLQKVDEDLLLNLIALKEDLSHYLSSESIYVLIERCLFSKFLEDRQFIRGTSLADILRNQAEIPLLEKFRSINELLNGDVFDENAFVAGQICPEVMERLHAFFTDDYRTRSSLFPYRFDIIPVQLLSSIYELFLKAEKQVTEGVYYTPAVLVDMVLRETLLPILEHNNEPTCFDFACGSGIFLVKALQRIIEKNACKLDFSKKRELLQRCIFGVEKDEVATRITIFSLYLTLLDGEDRDRTATNIADKKIRFPKLLNINILNRDTLYDEIKFPNHLGVFDVVFGNPPWGINPSSNGKGHRQMTIPEEKQSAVYKRQSSQYFLLKAGDFMKAASIAGIVCNNSNFVMEKGKRFRQEMLKQYTLNSFTELSKCNSILFQKKTIGSLQMGASEPAAVVVFRKKNKERDNTLKYVTPSLDPLSKLLQIPVVHSSDVKLISQVDLSADDQLWRVLLLGDLEDYGLVQKIKGQGTAIRKRAFNGFQPQEAGPKPLRMNEYFDVNAVQHYVFDKTKLKVVTSGVMRVRNRSGGIYDDSDERAGRKLAIKRYVGADLRVTAAYDEDGYRFKDDVIGLVAEYDYMILLPLLNSSLISYFLVFNSSQIAKGTWNMLHLNEIENIQLPAIKTVAPHHKKALRDMTKDILRKGFCGEDAQQRIDEVVFDIYRLREFERHRIDDFFAVLNREKNKRSIATISDLQRYAVQFREVFGFVLREDKFLNSEIYVSATLGAAVSFKIVDREKENESIETACRADDIAKLLALYGQRNTCGDVIGRGKAQFYQEERLIIVKSNQFKDWTRTEATKDANHEISLFMRHLGER